jgi:hypothetical protein
MNENTYIELLTKCLVGYLYPESSYLEIRPHRDMGAVKKRFLKGMNKRGYKIFKVQPFDATARATGMDWPSIGYSMVGLKRLRNLQSCVETVLRENVPGDFIETGVWRGGACILVRAVLKAHDVRDRNVWLADSFEGLPAPSLEADDGYDLPDNSYLAVSVEEVKAAFERFGLMDEQVKFLKGWFKDTLPTAAIDSLAILRMDGDLYESTRDALKSLYDKVSPNGFVVVDDYGTWPPCKRAVDEFRTQRGIIDPIQNIDGSGVFWRKCSASA